VLGHAETLLAAVRHLITNESCAPNLSQPGSRHGQSFMRFAKTMITSERIALIVKRREVETVSLREQNAAVRCACHPGAVVSRQEFQSGSATAFPHTRQTCATSFNHPHDAVHTTLSQLLNFLHATPTARFRRVVPTARQSLPVYPDKQTISEPIGTSRANFGRAHRIFHQQNPK
jgi:hypothetical protein